MEQSCRSSTFCYCWPGLPLSKAHLSLPASTAFSSYLSFLHRIRSSKAGQGRSAVGPRWAVALPQSEKEPIGSRSKHVDLHLMIYTTQLAAARVRDPVIEQAGL